MHILYATAVISVLIWTLGQWIDKMSKCPFCGVRINSYGTNHDEYCNRYHNRTR